MKITKEYLIKENAKIENTLNDLKDTLNDLKDKDIRLRDELGKVLDITRQRPFYYGSTEKLSWEEIFFRIGELNSDANYTILLEQKRMLEDKLKEQPNEE